MLVLKAFDKISNESISELPNVVILITDTLNVIKDKVCIKSAHLFNLPNLIKIAYKKDDKYIFLEKDSDVLDIPDNKIYVLKIADILLERLRDMIEYPDALLDELKLDGYSFTDNEYIMISNLIKVGNDLIKDNNFVQTYVDYSQEIKESITDKITKNTSKDLNNFYKKSDIEYLNDYTRELYYTNVNIIIKGNNVENNDHFIKLHNIFNLLELTGDIPLIGLNKKFSNDKNEDPLIKIYDRILDTGILPNEVKDWVLNGSNSYKTIKGLMLKVKTNFDNYLTMNLLPNGIIYIKYSSKDTTNLNTIRNIIKININNVILQLNKMNIFNKEKTINTLDKSDIIIDSMDITTITNFNIPLQQFKKIIQKETFNVFKYKDTISNDVLSLYYEGDKILNIRDYLDTSKINIYNIKNEKLYKIVMNYIYIINLISRNKDNNQLITEIKKIKEKSKKKLLKEQGINFDSRKCQHHPSIIESNGDLKSDEINFENKYYKCDDPTYKYPGFTVNNILCCYTKPQIGTETYIRNIDPKSFDILVQPSNFKVFINGDFETYVIKMISNYKQELDDTLFYYINKNNIIQPILNKELINAINKKEQDDKIWFDTISLAQLIYPSSSSKCSNKPDLTNRYNLNGPCDKSDLKYFGYGASGIPCCFDDSRNDTITKQKKEYDITSTHKIQAHKPLKNLQIGKLSLELDKIFNSSGTQLMHYRIGVFQNNNAFLNTILLGMKSDYHLDGIIQFKQLLSKYLDSNKEEFIKLNNGDIFIKYKSVENYKNVLNDIKKYINWYDFIDLLEKALNINIIILEENILDKNKYETRMVCRSNKKFNENPTLIVLKTKYEDDTKDSYELIIRIDENANIKNKIITTFSHRNPTTKFLIEYYNNTCVKRNVYPEKYPYIPLLNYNNFDIKYQIVNKLNKVFMVITNSGAIVPIIEQGIINDIKTIQLTDLINTTVPWVWTLEEFIIKNFEGENRWRRVELDNILKELNLSTNVNEQITNKTIYDKIVNYLKTQEQIPKLVSLNVYINYFKKIKREKNINIKILGLLKTNNKNIGGIMTNFGSIVPYLRNDSEYENDFTKLDYTYYLFDIDSITNNGYNMYSKYIENKIKLNKDLHQMKITLSNNITMPSDQSVKKFIEELTKTPNIPRYNKLQTLIKTFHSITNNKYVNNSYIEFIFSIIANDIINDNFNLLINGIIEDTNVENRDNETVLLNIDDIYKWLKTNKN
jgi:hypothetical protein